MPLTMTGADIVASFVISWFAGNIPTIKDAIQNTPTLKERINKCFNKALKRWNVPQETRDLMADTAEKHFFELEQFLNASKKGINPKTRDLLVLWTGELHNDELCYAFILEHKIDINNASLSELGLELKQGFDELISQNTALLQETNSIQQSVALLSEKVTDMAMSFGLSAEITCSDSVDDICPIPEVVAERRELLDKCQKILDNEFALHIYGSYRSGKSVLSCLLAKRYPEYVKMIIPFNRLPISFAPLRQIASEKGKKIIILDGLNIEDSDKCSSFCKLVKQITSIDCLLIVNSYTSFKDISFGVTSPINEIETTSLTEEDVNSMFTDENRVWVPVVCGVTSGAPQLVLLAYTFLSAHNFTLDTDQLGKLFTLDGELNIADSCRRVLNKMVPNQDALLLLNRLLLYTKTFTEDDAKAIATVEPAIDMPLYSLSALTGLWVNKNDGRYEVIPLLRKSVKPDLNKFTLKSCCRLIAERILKKQTLGIGDVVDVLTLYVKGEHYEEAAQFYIYTLHKLNDANLLDNRHASIAMSMWIDLPLPDGMSIGSKVYLRMSQLVIIGFKNAEKCKFIAKDLESLLCDTRIENAEVKSICYLILSVYYSLIGDIERALATKIAAKPSPKIANVLTKIDEKSMFLVQLSKVKDEEGLKALMVEYKAMGEEPWHLLYDGCNCAIHSIATAKGGVDYPALERILDWARKDLDVMYPFAVSAAGAIMANQAATKCFDDAFACFENNKDLLNYKFGLLQMNFAYGSCLEDMGDKEKAGQYYLEASKVRDLDINSAASLYSIVAASDYFGRQDSVEAVALLVEFMKRPGFFEFLTTEQQMQFYGSLAIAYWFNNQQEESMRIASIISDYVWNNRSKVDDSYKHIVLSLSIMVMQMHFILKDGIQNPEHYNMSRDLFVKNIYGLNELFAENKIFGISFILAMLKDSIHGDRVDIYSDVVRSVELTKTVLRPEDYGAPALLCFIPVLMNHHDMDAVEHILLMTAAQYKNINDAPENLEYSYLYTGLMFIGCCRSVEKINGRAFDDAKVFEVVRKYLAYFNEESKQKMILGSLKPEFEDFNGIQDDYLKTVSYVWHYDRFSANDLLSLMFKVYSIIKNSKEQKSLVAFLQSYMISLTDFAISKRRNDFSLAYIDVAGLRRKALSVSGYESTVRLMQAYYHLLKTEPKLSQELEDLLIG